MVRGASYSPRPGQFVNILTDISERKQAEESLRKSEERFSKAFRSSPDAIIISRLSDGLIIEVNNGWTELFGHEPAEVAAWPVVGTSGNERPEKGYQHLVEAAPAILERFPQAAFVLLGAGTQRLAPRIAELGLQDRFRLPGHRTDALEVMSLFDLFVFPGVDMDSCANVLLEAMTHGCPAMAFDCPSGPQDIIYPCKNGLLLRAEDSAALAAAIAQLCSDPALRKRLGDAARDVQKRFSQDSIVARREQLFAGT